MSRHNSVIKIFIAFLLLILSRTVFAAENGIRTEGRMIFIENKSVQYIVSGDGQSQSFFDKLEETEYLDTSRPHNFMTLIRKDKTIYSTSVLYNRGQLIVRFDPDWTVIKLDVDVWDDYFVFEVVWANSNDFDELRFCDLPLSIQGNVGRSLNICRNETFGVALLALNYSTNCRIVEIDPIRFVGSAYPEFDHIGTKLAVVTGPSDKMLDIIGKLEQEQGLPHPMLDGVWSKVSRDAEKSYLFVDYTEKNVDRAIEYAKKGGFKYLCMYLGTWAKTCGNYKINLENYPRGFESVTATVDKIHAAGLKAGAHTMSGSIYKFDDYVTPIPDKRLAKDGERILAADIGSDDDFIPVTESPEGFSLEASYLSRGGMDLQIGDELITYSGYSTTEPFGFTGCTRGAHGTFVSDHKKGETVYHMAERYNWYMVGGKTSMVEEIAGNIADAINRCGFDWVYYDGSEALAGQGPYWYYVGKVLDAIGSRFNREVLVQGSSMPHFNWHQYSRGGQIDWVWQDQKNFVDWYTENSARHWKYNNLMPIEFGWYGFFIDGPGGESTVPDEIEHVLSKCLAYNAAWSFETNMNTLDNHGRIDEILEMSKNYEIVRLNRFFSENIRKKLREKNKDFKLESDGRGGWTISPIVYGPDKYVQSVDDNDNKWSFINPHTPQPLKVRIKARPDPAAYDDSENIVLVDADNVSRLKFSSADEEFSCSVSQSTEQVKIGNASIKLSCNNTSDQVSRWAAQTLDFEIPLDLNTHHALGVWVYGNADGGALVIQLQNPPAVFTHNHVIDLDFDGWKYCEFLCPTGMDILNYSVPRHPWLGLRGYNYQKVAHVALILTNVPPHTEVECFLSTVKALREYQSTVLNPGLTVNGQKITFPAELETNHYLEFWGTEKAKVFDPDGHLIKEISPVGSVPVLRPGDNEIQYFCNTGEESHIHSRVTIIAKGEPLRD